MISDRFKLTVFVTVGIFTIFFSIILISNFSLRSTYNVYVITDNAFGIVKNTKVKMAGVDIGTLNKIFLDKSKAKLKLSINKKVVLYKNASAKIMSMGIFGNKYIEIIPGDSNFNILRNGESIIEPCENLSLENILIDATKKINKIFCNEKNNYTIENLFNIISFLKDITNNIANQNDKISNIINNFDKFSADLATFSKDGKQNLIDTILLIKNFSAQLNMLITKISNENGLIQTIINDKQLGNNLKETVISAKEAMMNFNCKIKEMKKLNWDYLVEYNIKDKEIKNNFGLTASTPKKFYHVGMSNIYNHEYYSSSNLKKANINKLNVLLGFKLEGMQIYGGIMNGKIGVGLGYHFSHLHIPYKFISSNLNIYKKDYSLAIDVVVKFKLFKWFSTGIMIENITYKPSIEPYLKFKF
ncbi:MAG: MlaD family protein [Endomicrobium sp.]|nr:MlaD family protein [Endomicrobium sp.]